MTGTIRPGTDYNIRIKQGTDFRRDLVVKDENGVAIDFGGYTARFRAFWRDTTISITTGLLDDSTDGDFAEGVVHVHLTTTHTREVPLGKQMRYAVEVWAPGDNPPGSGDQTVILEGYLIGMEGDDNVD